jgi:LuxR family transcriptional regulator, maltose regulon positive regulatory protein
MLQTLDRGNLFMVPLDDHRQWYRYHHLFADVMHTHLLDEQPEEIAELHRRASQWYELTAMITPAVRHALLAGDAERAAGLIELAIPTLLRDRQEATLRGWIDDIPAEVVRNRPVLAVGFIGALMSCGEFDGIAERLSQVEGAPPGLSGAIEMYRAALALAEGDVDSVRTHAQSAIDLAQDTDLLTRSGASAILGLVDWSRGELEAAHRRYSVCVEGMQRAGHLADVLGCSITLADIRITQGRLGDAMRTYQQALRLTSDEPTLRGTADMYVGMAQLACELGDLPTANQHLLHAQELGEHTWLPQNPYRWRLAMARVRQAEGDLSAAVALLDEADRLYVGDFSPNVRPVPAVRARLWVAQGRLAEARSWARELSVEDELSYLREYEHLTLARILLAGSPDKAAVLLERLLLAAEDGGRIGSVIEILVLQALVHQSYGDLPGALVPLERALQLAEPEGYVRRFLDEGRPMQILLQAGAKRGITPRRLLTAPQPGLIEPLSARENDVLRLLRSDLGGPEIARRLVLSLHTVRTHTKNIYAKLGVNNRRAAVRRAEELNL